jgi:DNA polymerase-3 subunit gamma/tau
MKNLASQYRPRKIKELVGQNHIKQALSNLLRTFSVSGEFPRSLILQGPFGTGKTTVARILVSYANCDNGPLKACMECESCLSMLKDNNPDYWEIDAASNNGVADISKFQEWAALKTRRRRRFLLVDEAHRLSKQAWDCLLKFLEDNQQNATFVFCTTEREKIPETIISRSTELKLLKIRPEDLFELGKDVAAKENLTFESDECLLHLVRKSDGHARDLLKNLEQVELFSTTSGFISNEAVYTMLEIYNVDAAKKLISALMSKDRNVVMELIHSQQTTADYLMRSVLELLRHELYSRSILKNDTEYKEIPFKELVAICGLLEDTILRVGVGYSFAALYIALERWWSGSYYFCEELGVHAGN